MTQNLDFKIHSFIRHPDIIKVEINGTYYEARCDPFIYDRVKWLLTKSKGKSLAYLRAHCKLEKVMNEEKFEWDKKLKKGTSVKLITRKFRHFTSVKGKVMSYDGDKLVIKGKDGKTYTRKSPQRITLTEEVCPYCKDKGGVKGVKCSYCGKDDIKEDFYFDEEDETKKKSKNIKTTESKLRETIHKQVESQLKESISKNIKDEIVRTTTKQLKETIKKQVSKLIKEGYFDDNKKRAEQYFGNERFSMMADRDGATYYVGNDTHKTFPINPRDPRTKNWKAGDTLK